MNDKISIDPRLISVTKSGAVDQMEHSPTADNKLLKRRHLYK